ncbi:hypothetical protein LMG22037_03597 [Paraburkholderia phenoliruptrix]|uniref:Lipoprotein n=1 Tax=Paraburkholderia phenoliruptrix TaxID=252970 RepID=A0A6J5BFV4_9BURK|nr:hypothetical protein [Paraburkholderia phenoliruptrix]CAB3702773.1 hypothetical protein LMG22037_03597 [Paraburkholderia phenoliruptrix]
MNKGLLPTLRDASVAIAAIAAMAAAGCSTQGQVDPDVMQIATTPLTCSNKAECDLWWQRAQTWVTSHSKYKVEAATDTLIQTAGPDGGKRALAYQITRTPNPDGTATIGFAAHCDGSLGCKPNPWEAGADFKQYVRGTAAGTQGNDAKPSQPASAAMHPEARQGQSAAPSAGAAASQ